MARKLTSKSVEQARPRKNARGELVRTEIPDAGKPGLYLVIQPSGRKSWALRYRRLSDGKPRKLTLDGFPSLRMAHKLSQDALDNVAEGGDPAAQKFARKHAVARDAGRDLFETVAVDFINRYAKKKNRSWAETARLLGLVPEPKRARVAVADVIPLEQRPLTMTDGGLTQKWSKLRIQEISRRDIIELLDSLVDRGAGITANRTLAALRKMFHWAIERDIIGASPCAGVKPLAPEMSRDRVLSDDELRWFWQACDNSGFPFGPLFQLLLITAQRRNEVGDIVATEIDLNERLWTMPKARAKNNAEHHVPLSNLACEVIEALPRIAGNKGYLFTTNGQTPVSGYSRAKDRLDREMLRLARKDVEKLGADPAEVSIPHWTLHDLRRTASSNMARLGIPVHVTEAALNHKSGTIRGVAAVYNRYNYADEKRGALEAWGRFVTSIAGPTDAENVVTLRRQ